MRDDGRRGTTDSTRQEWRRPELRKLPIATTASGTKDTIIGNDGGGVGKGETSSTLS